MNVVTTLARGVVRTRAFLCRHPRLVRPFVWLRRHWWLALFAVALWLLVRQPNGARLDSGSIFALAGLAVVVLSLTFPVILLIVQNLSQRAMKDLLEEFKRQGLWKEPMATQAAAILIIVAGDLWHATVSTGAAALFLLAGLFAEGYGAFRRLLDQMSPVALANHLVQRRTAELRRYRAAGLFGQPLADRKATEALEAVLDIAAAALGSSDIELLRVALDRANDICLAYLDVSFSIGYGDPVSDLLTVRLGSLLKAAAASSTSVILPEVTRRVAKIGATVAGYRREGFIDVGVVPYSIITLLAEALEHGVHDDRSSARADAIRGITSIGVAYVAASRIAGTQRPIAQLRAVVRAAAKDQDQFFLRQAGSGLVQIACSLSTVAVGDIMVPHCLERGRDALKEIAELDADGHVPGAATFIVNPIEPHGFNLAAVTVHVVRQALACGDDYHRDEFVRLGRSLFKIVERLAASDAADIQTRSDAIRALTGVVLTGIGDNLHDALPDLLTAWWNAAVVLLVEKENARKSLDISEYHLAELLLTAFYAGLEADDAGRAMLDGLLFTALDVVAGQSEREQWILSPVIRLLGAAAVHNDAVDVAARCAHVVVPPPPSARRSLSYGDWFYAPHGSEDFMPWPARRIFGIDFPSLPAHHNDPAARRAFLALEDPDISGLSDAQTWQYWPREEVPADVEAE